MANTLYTDFDNAQQVIDKCEACYIAMIDQDNKPYVLPFNFGFENNTIYLHSGPVGRKLDIMRNNPEVCVNFSTDHKLFFRNEEVACSYGMRYRSVLAFGKIVFVEDYDEKVECMNIIMRKYTGKDFSYNPPAINNLVIYKVVIDKIETKISNY
ncbi:MAG: pyridoxamine 5'-phosphate oxidase family protein [Bacteroidota bacterium]